MIPERKNSRGYTTISVGIAGAKTLWGLGVSHNGTVRDVASGSVAATSLVRPQVRYALLCAHSTYYFAMCSPLDPSR